MSKEHKNFSPQFKAKVVLELLQGDVTVTELASKYGVYTAPTCQDYFFIIHLPIPSLTHS